MNFRQLRKQSMIFSVALATLLCSSCATNPYPDPSKEELAKAKPYPLDVCLVIEKPLSDTPKTYTKIYKGQEVKFCCVSCVAAFEANPDFFLKKIQ